MDTNETTVETAEAAEALEVSQEVDTATDYEAELAQQREEIARLTRDRDNYREATLKLKGKKVDDDDGWGDTSSQLTREEAVELAKQAAKEALAESELAKALEAEKAITEKALRENKELKIALQNKPTAGASMGAGADTSAPATVDTLPNSVVADLKAKGWSDEKIQKLRQNYASGNK